MMAVLPQEESRTVCKCKGTDVGRSTILNTQVQNGAAPDICEKILA